MNWKVDRVADGACLENRRRESVRGFESLTFRLWKDVRAVDGARLESAWGESSRRFESCSFRNNRTVPERFKGSGLNPAEAEASVSSNLTRSGCPVNVTGRSSRRA